MDGTDKDTVHAVTRAEKRLLFSLVFVVISFTLSMLGYQLWHISRVYDGAVATVENCIYLDKAAMLTLARAGTADMIKATAMFLAYALIFTGSAYTIYALRADLRLSGEDGTRRGILETSSPGMFFVLIGSLLIAVIMVYASSKFEFTQSDGICNVLPTEAPAGEVMQGGVHE